MPALALNRHVDTALSYEALARRWRPRNFADMLGQQHVLRALTNALDHDRLHHAYLFTGTRGVGKTTIARIFAKSLNCEKGVTSTPCGECSACVQVDEGRFLDLIEVDAASRTGVDDTRELLDNVAYAPGSGRFKVYLIDEVHMFSKSSFNALLKTLEEPPPHVKFLLATTDPQKLPVTVLSRCLQFNLKAMPAPLLQPYLIKLMEQEQIDCEDAALAHIAQAADGSVRDGLSLLDQAIAYGQGKVTAADVEAMLGRFSPARLYDLLDTLAEGRGDRMFELLDSIAEYVPDYTFVLGELLGLLNHIARLQVVPGSVIEGLSDPARVQALAEKIDPQDIQLWYQIGLVGRRDMPYATSQRQSIEMTLIRMLAFAPADGQSAGAPAVQTAPPPAATAPSPAPTASRPAAPAPPPAAPAAPPAPTAPARKNPTPAPPPDVATPAATADAAPEVADSALATPAKLDWKTDQWEQIVAELPVSGMPKQLARNCVLGSAKGDELVLLVDPEYANLARSQRSFQRLQEKIGVYAGGAVKLSIEVPDTWNGQSPAALEVQAQQAQLEQARASIASDPIVKEICDTFDATVSEGSIVPKDG
jgi:DNA polymerase-3 subunit gamma/tau